MDPEANLKDQEALARFMINILDTEPAITDESGFVTAAEYLAELDIAYCEWRQKGGFA